MDPVDDKRKQISIAERLQLKLLERWEKLLDSNELQATDAATLARLLAQNGWNIDPAKLPAGLRSVLTESIDPRGFDDDEEAYN